MRLLLLGVLAGLAIAESGLTLIEGHALGSDSAVHSSINGHSTEAARSAPPGFERAGGTSQPACGASRNMLGVPTDVQRKIFNRGSLGGPRKTCSALDGCRGGGDYVEKMVSVKLAGAGAAGSSAHHVPNASASLGEDACAEAAKRKKCVMNECACATSESWDASCTCGADGGEALGQSRPTIEIAQGEKLLQTGARGFVRAIVDKISTVTTGIQRRLHRSEQMPNESEALGEFACPAELRSTRISDSNAVESDLFSVSSGYADWQRACASFDRADSSLLEVEHDELERADQALGRRYAHSPNLHPC